MEGNVLRKWFLYLVLLFTLMLLQVACDTQVDGDGITDFEGNLYLDMECVEVYSCRIIRDGAPACVDYPAHKWNFSAARDNCRFSASFVHGEIQGWSKTSCAEENYDTTWRCEVGNDGTNAMPELYIYHQDLPVDICNGGAQGHAEDREGDTWLNYENLECVPFCNDESCLAEEEEEEPDCTPVSATVSAPEGVELPMMLSLDGEYYWPEFWLYVGFYEPSELPPTALPQGGFFEIPHPASISDSRFQFSPSYCTPFSVKEPETEYHVVLVLDVNDQNLDTIVPEKGVDYWWVSPTAETYEAYGSIDLGNIELELYQ